MPDLLPAEACLLEARIKERSAPPVKVRDLSALDSAMKWLDELLQACRKYGPIYNANPKLTATVTRKARALRQSLYSLKEFVRKPGK